MSTKRSLIPDDPYLAELKNALGPLEEEMDTAKQFLILAGERDALLAARAKDAELIQRLVDALRDVKELMDAIGTPSCLCGGIGSMLESVTGNALDAASEHGFKPRQLLKDF